MIKPVPTSQVTKKGMYIHFLDYNNYCGAFYEFDPEDDYYKWRSDGCGDCGPFDDSDYWIGPIDTVKDPKESKEDRTQFDELFSDKPIDYTSAQITGSKHFVIHWCRHKVGFGQVAISVREDGVLMVDSEAMTKDFVKELFGDLIKNAVWKG